VLTGPDDQTWEWDGELWKQVTEIGPGVNSSHAMTYDGRAVILFGGDNLQQTGFFKQSGSTWEWDGKHWTQRLQIGPEPRTDCAIAYASSETEPSFLVDSTDPPKDPMSHSAILGSWPKNCRLFLLTRQAAAKRDGPPFPTLELAFSCFRARQRSNLTRTLIKCSCGKIIAA
jgi:hypothetical protein